MKQPFSPRKQGIILLATGVSAFIMTAAVARAGVTYQDGDKYLKVGGRIQLQYHSVSPDGGASTDEMFFRRFRPYIEGSVHKDWLGKFQWDMGKSDLAVKDAYVQYSGFDAMKITVGNANFPFSRELLTSSKTQQLVERTFVGDHNYGSPGRNAGIHLTGHTMAGKKLTWGAALASASLDPDTNKLDFDTPVNADADFNEGGMVGGRVDFHPFGGLKMSQGDFERKVKATIGVGGYLWINDGDNNTFTTAGVTNNLPKSDVDSVSGFEVSTAFRGAGFSVDAEYNIFNAETVDPTVTSGIYRNGETTLRNYAIEGGYMVMAERLELVAGYQSQDADNYATAWTRTSVGANWFLQKQDIKVQLTYRVGENLQGVIDSNEDEIFLQTQYVF
jgi:phosphate-selective porin